MTKNIVDFVLLDIIENHYNEIVYKSTASQFYKQFIDFVIYMILVYCLFKHLEY